MVLDVFGVGGFRSGGGGLFWRAVVVVSACSNFGGLGCVGLGGRGATLLTRELSGDAGRCCFLSEARTYFVGFGRVNECLRWRYCWCRLPFLVEADLELEKTACSSAGPFLVNFGCSRSGGGGFWGGSGAGGCVAAAPAGGVVVV